MGAFSGGSCARSYQRPEGKQNSSVLQSLLTCRGRGSEGGPCPQRWQSLPSLGEHRLCPPLPLPASSLAVFRALSSLARGHTAVRGPPGYLGRTQGVFRHGWGKMIRLFLQIPTEIQDFLSLQGQATGRRGTRSLGPALKPRTCRHPPSRDQHFGCLKIALLRVSPSKSCNVVDTPTHYLT